MSVSRPEWRPEFSHSCSAMRRAVDRKFTQERYPISTPEPGQPVAAIHRIEDVEVRHVIGARQWPQRHHTARRLRDSFAIVRCTPLPETHWSMHSLLRSDMNDEFERLFTMYDGGHLNRRQLLQGLLGLGLGSGVVSTRSDASASDGLREPLFHAHTINHVTIRAADVPRSIAMWLRMHRLTPRWRRRTGERGGSSRDRWADFQHSSTGERRWSWHGVPAVRRHQGQTGKQNQRGGDSRLVMSSPRRSYPRRTGLNSLLRPPRDVDECRGDLPLPRPSAG